MARRAENYLEFVKGQHGYYSNYPIYAPITDTGGQVFNVKSPTFGAKGNGATDDFIAIQNAMNTAALVGGVVLFPPGNYIISSPLTWYKTTATIEQLAPSLQGSYGLGGSSTDIGEYGPVKLTASSSFPNGQFMIDYIGSKTTTFSALTGFSIAGFAMECKNKAAGIRLANHESSILENCVLNDPRTPSPSDNVGSPTAGVNLVLVNNVDGSYNNKVKNVYVFGAGKDGFYFAEGGSSSVTATGCNAINCGGSGFVTSPNTTLIDCDSQTNSVAGYYSNGGKFIGCTTYFSNNANQVIIDHAFDFGNPTISNFVDCSFYGTGTDAGTEEKNAVVAIKWVENRTTFSGCYMKAEGHTSDWLYVESGAVTKSAISFQNCDFDPNNGAVTNVPFNFNGNPNISIKDCKGINPDISYPAGNVTGATTFTRTNGDHQTATQTGNITVTLTNGLIVGDQLTLEIVTAGHTQSWPGNLNLAGGAYVMTGTSTLTARWDGTNWVEQSRALAVA